MIIPTNSDPQSSIFGEETITIQSIGGTSIQNNAFSEILIVVKCIPWGKNFNQNCIVHGSKMVHVADTPSSLLTSDIIHNFYNNNNCPTSMVSNNTNSDYLSNGSRSTLISTNNIIFIFKGIILSPVLSFAFQGINDGDEIYVVSKTYQEKNDILANNNINSGVFLTRKNSQLRACPFYGSIQKLRNRFDQRWAQKFDDPESVFAQIRCASDPKTAAESARIADICKMRFEEQNPAFMKTQSYFLFASKNEGSMGQTPTINERPNRMRTVLPKKAKEPSSDMLPELWINSSSASFNSYHLSSSV